MANVNFHNVSREEEALRLAYTDLIAFGKLFLPDDFMRSETPFFHYEVTDAGNLLGFTGTGQGIVDIVISIYEDSFNPLDPEANRRTESSGASPSHSRCSIDSSGVPPMR